jgi:hypothetical protein
MNKLVMDTIKPLNIPISFQKYSGASTTYITFFEYDQRGESFADDNEIDTGHYIQLDIWSKSDYSSIVSSVKSAMKAVGFTRLSETDLYEDDTKIYHKGIRFYYLEEV